MWIGRIERFVQIQKRLETSEASELPGSKTSRVFALADRPSLDRLK